MVLAPVLFSWRGLTGSCYLRFLGPWAPAQCFFSLHIYVPLHPQITPFAAKDSQSQFLVHITVSRGRCRAHLSSTAIPLEWGPITSQRHPHPSFLPGSLPPCSTHHHLTSCSSVGHHLKLKSDQAVHRITPLQWLSIPWTGRPQPPTFIASILPAHHITLLPPQTPALPAQLLLDYPNLSPTSEPLHF